MVRPDLSQLSVPLLAWYEKNARLLPWRENRDPYRIWVSEIMLQQTRVETVKVYFTRFMQALPDLASLAAAPEEQVLKLWEGLGYYSRVRNLQKAAQQIVASGDDRLPASYAALLRLPGIGPYTAGAIASIAFGIPVPAVDGNVLRIMSRIMMVEADILQPRVKQEISEQVQAMIPLAQAGDFTQALMELGSLICVPRGLPQCGDCPVRLFCRAYEADQVLLFPIKGQKKARKIEERTVFVFVHEGTTALRKRAMSGLLAGLWEFPHVEGVLTAGEVKDLVQAWGMIPAEISPLVESKHIFTHIVWQMSAYLVVVQEKKTGCNLCWMTKAEIKSDVAVPSAFKVYTDIVRGILP